MDLKRSNNNKLIYIKKKTRYILPLLRNTYPKKSEEQIFVSTRRGAKQKAHLYSFARLDLSSPIFIFRIQNSQNRIELVRSHQNAMFRSNRFISPPFFLFFIRQNTRIYVYTHIHNCSVQFRNSWEGLSRFKPEPTPSPLLLFVAIRRNFIIRAGWPLLHWIGQSRENALSILKKRISYPRTLLCVFFRGYVQGVTKSWIDVNWNIIRMM